MLDLGTFMKKESVIDEEIKRQRDRNEVIGVLSGIKDDKAQSLMISLPYSSKQHGE